MRETIVELKKNSNLINSQCPVDLIIDHSIHYFHFDCCINAFKIKFNCTVCKKYLREDIINELV